MISTIYVPRATTDAMTKNTLNLMELNKDNNYQNKLKNKAIQHVYKNYNTIYSK